MDIKMTCMRGMESKGNGVVLIYAVSFVASGTCHCRRTWGSGAVFLDPDTANPRTDNSHGEIQIPDARGWECQPRQLAGIMRNMSKGHQRQSIAVPNRTGARESGRVAAGSPFDVSPTVGLAGSRDKLPSS